MDAIEFIKELNRMCKSCGSCALCPAWSDDRGCAIAPRSCVVPEQQINTVKEWSAVHPLKTYQSAFLEQYPNAKLDSEGILCLCPGYVYGYDVCAKTAKCNMFCYDCRHKFWSQEVKE